MAILFKYLPIWILMFLMFVQIHVYGLPRCSYFEYYYVDAKYNYSAASAQCISLGYDGLAVLTTLQQRTRAEIYLTSIRKMPAYYLVWTGFVYKEPPNIWGWKQAGVWMTMLTEYTIPWYPGDPTNEGTKTNSVMNYASYSVSGSGWWSVRSTFKARPVCQRKLTSVSSMTEDTIFVYFYNKEPIANQPLLDVRDRFHCISMCLIDCSCLFIYYHNNTCQVIQTYIDSIGPGSGTYYMRYTIA